VRTRQPIEYEDDDEEQAKGKCGEQHRFTGSGQATVPFDHAGMRQDGFVSNPTPVFAAEPLAWIEADPDPTTLTAIQELSADPEALAANFAKPLRFGTAGLRAERGVGPARMNRITARVAARAMGRHLEALKVAHRGVIIGYDARPESDIYALDSARLLTAMGITCWLIDGPCPTPVVAWHLRERQAAAAIVVTASHNPARDSGYKVFGSDGTQIRPPADAQIEELMTFSYLPSESDLAPVREVGHIDLATAISSYVEAVIPKPKDTQPSGGQDPWVYTPLCGVGGDTLEMACSRAGINAPVRVESQFEPDGLFPGIPFPNPEEPGTMNQAYSVAEEAGIDLVLANDPDADRLAVAIKTASGWHQLSGDEVGLLLCDHQLSNTTGDNRLTASSVVSSQAVAALCARRGVEHIRTLTGFKWIMEPVVTRPEARWIFGYEEALGYSVNDRVLDKDGIAAGVTFMKMVADLRRKNLDPLARLDELAAEIGLYVTSQVSARFESLELESCLKALRSTPPRELAGSPIVEIKDWLDQPFPHNTNLLEFRSKGGSRVSIRPSGTEPKVKIYLEQFVQSPQDDLASARAQCDEQLESLGLVALSWFRTES
jgi:phosphomannomutase